MPSVLNVSAEQDCSRGYQPTQPLNPVMPGRRMYERLWRPQNRYVCNAALHRYSTNPSTRVNYSNLHEQYNNDKETPILTSPVSNTNILRIDNNKISIHVAGTKFSSLIDTGAQISIIKKCI